MITIEKLDASIDEARRFITAAQTAKTAIKKDHLMAYGCKETGAVKRASMDLTRMLAEFRKAD